MVSAASALFGAGCLTGRWSEAKQTDDPDELRRFIQERPDDLEASEALQRIAKIEFREAKKVGTRYAYASFLERHAGSSLALDAQGALERLDLEAATQVGTPEAFLGFLRLHPRSTLAEQAHLALEELLCRRTLAAPTRADLERLLAERPDLACRAELVAALRALRLAEALESDALRPALEFLAEHPEDPDARPVRERLLARQLTAWLQAGLFERAASRVQAEANVEQAAPLLLRIDEARRAWQAAEFLESARDTRRARYLQRMAPATRRLRAPPVPSVPRDGGQLSDPRQRWLFLSELWQAPDEAHADSLLAALGDPYLEVRAAAWRSLFVLVPLLGPVRSETWRVQTRAQLDLTARSSVPLLKLAAVAWLSGDLSGAAVALTRLLAEEDPPDLFSLVLAEELALLRGEPVQAASLARRLAEQARGFGERRREAWSQSDGYRDSAEGFLVLRQVHGLVRLWTRSLTPFRGGVSAAESSLGPWLERAESDLAELSGWLTDEEGRWARSHPGYLPGSTPAPVQADPTPMRSAALVELTFLGGQRAGPSLDWAACCATPPELRLQVAALRAGLGLTRLAASPAWVP